MRFGAYETAPHRVQTDTGLGFVLPLALFSGSSRTTFKSGRFSFGHEWVGGGGNSHSFTGVLGQSNGQESHTYRNRFGKTCFFSSGIGPHPVYWATRPKPSRLPYILRQRRAHSAVTAGANDDNDTFGGYQDWQVWGSISVRNWWARQRGLLRIVVICPTTSASIPFLNC